VSSDAELLICIAAVILVAGIWLGWELGFRDHGKLTAKALMKSGRR